MPKPAYCDHFRILSGAMISADAIGISKYTPLERVYCSMPLYHRYKSFKMSRRGARCNS